MTLLAWLLGPLLEQLDRIEKSLAVLTKGQEAIMSEVRVTQEDLDALDLALDEVTTAIATKLEALAAQHPELPAADLAALAADVDALRTLAAPTPTEETP